MAVASRDGNPAATPGQTTPRCWTGWSGARRRRLRPCSPTLVECICDRPSLPGLVARRSLNRVRTSHFLAQQRQRPLLRPPLPGPPSWTGSTDPALAALRLRDRAEGLVPARPRGPHGYLVGFLAATAPPSADRRHLLHRLLAVFTHGQGTDAAPTAFDPVAGVDVSHEIPLTGGAVELAFDRSRGLVLGRQEGIGNHIFNGCGCLLRASRPRRSPVSSPSRPCSVDGLPHVLHCFVEVIEDKPRGESQHSVSVRSHHLVSAVVPVAVFAMLPAVNFDHEAGRCTVEIGVPTKNLRLA